MRLDGRAQALGRASLSRQRRLRVAPELGQERLAARRDAVFRRLLVAADVAAATFGLAAVTAVGGDRLTAASVVVVPLVVALSKMLGLYDRDELVLSKASLPEAPGLFQLSTLYAIAIWLLESVVFVGALEKVQFVGLGVVVFAVALLGRTVARQLAARLTPPERCLVVGSQFAHRRLEERLGMSKPQHAAELVLRVDLDRREVDELTSGGLRKLVESNYIDRIIVIPGITESDLLLDVIREAKSLGIKVNLLPRFSEVLGSSMIVDEIYGMTMLAVRRFGLNRSSQLVKRGFDLMVGGLSLLAMTPLLLMIAIAIRLESPGGIFFRQTRVGRRGKSFRILKFRTMVVDADAMKEELRHLNESQGLFKMTQDPRITRVGGWLRRTSMDELPQLLNVLRGDMSLVGPRPLVPEEDRQIEGWYRERLNLAPGMTGQWQVLGSSRIPLQEMVAIDYLYVANWSLWTDVQYLLRTIPHVVMGRGL